MKHIGAFDNKGNQLNIGDRVVDLRSKKEHTIIYIDPGYTKNLKPRNKNSEYHYIVISDGQTFIDGTAHRYNPINFLKLL